LHYKEERKEDSSEDCEVLLASRNQPIALEYYQIKLLYSYKHTQEMQQQTKAPLNQMNI
jgi:hypothetical protein